MKKNRTIHYSVIHGLYWGNMAVISGFASVFLLFRGFTNSEIGIIMAAANIVTVLTSPIVSAFADKTTKISLNRLAALICGVVTLLSLVLCLVPSLLIVIAVVYVLLMSLNSIVIALVTSMSFKAESDGDKVNYGVARAIGSLAFAVIMMVLGKAIDFFTAECVPFFCLGFFILMTAAIFTFALKKREDVPDSVKEEESQNTGNMIEFFKKYKVLLWFLIGYMLIFMHQMVQTIYYFQIVEYKGGGTKELGIASAIAAVMEIPSIAGFTWMLKKKPCEFWLKLSALAYIVKSVSFWLVPNVYGIYAVALLQIVTYAIMYTAAIYYVEGTVEETDRVKGQGYVIASSTIGGIIASLLGGAIIDYISVNAQLIFGAAVCTLGSIIVFFSVRKKK